ncbi:YuiA family protein [Bacillus litorisediminis]|nr:YuiA family protein [Bacillus litorisediminis]
MEKELCPYCGGQGYICDSNDGGRTFIQRPCEMCEGRGEQNG